MKNVIILTWFDRKLVFESKELRARVLTLFKAFMLSSPSRSFISSFVFEAENAVSGFLPACRLKALNPHIAQGSTVLCFMLLQELE